MSILSNCNGTGERIDSYVPKKENVYDAEWRRITARLKREEEENEERERERNKQAYESLIVYMKNENRRNGSFSEVLRAIKENNEMKIRDNSRYLTDKMTNDYQSNRNRGLNVYTDNPYNNIASGRDYTIMLATAMLPDAAYNYEQYKYMSDSWKSLADEIEASIPDEVMGEIEAAIHVGKNYVRNNIGTYVEYLIDRMPMPPHVRVAVNVGYFFTITVCEALEEIQKKRAQELAWLESQTEYSQDEKKRRMQNKMIGWLLEEGGKEILNRMLDKVLERYHVPMHLQNQIKTAWSTFIAGDVWLGHWQPIIEREVTRMAPSYWLSAQYDGASELSYSPLVLRGIDAIGRVKHSLT